MRTRVRPKRVLLIQEALPEYRLPLYERLAAALREDGVCVRVAYSPANAHQAAKGDCVDLDGDIGICVPAWRAFGNRFVLQPLVGEIARADLVIVEQANRFVLNHWLLLLASLNLKKVAFWGLGENKQANRLAISEWYKRKRASRVDWFFAYTEGTAAWLQQQGVSRARITVVHNSVDTREISTVVSAMANNERKELRAALGIPPFAPVGVFCGMLEPVKGLDFLLTSSAAIKARLPGFHLLICGSGTLRPVIEQQASGSSWLRYLGPKFGCELATVLGLADVFLLPGRVGLAVLTGFAAGLPVIVTQLPIHGPEIEYLEDGINGRMTRHDPQAFADAVVGLLERPGELTRLSVGARASASQYTIEAMVENFRQGILQCLGS